jgi:Rha family phage regulatory protein
MATTKTHGAKPGKVTPNKKAAGGKTTTATQSISTIDSTDNLIQAHGRNLWTSTVLIANKFRKRHDNVLRAVGKLECSKEFWRLNFEERDYVDGRGKLQKSFDVSRDGFSLLAMKFTGPGAAKWQQQFIEAFGKMERELLRLASRKTDPALRIASNEKSAAALLMTDCLLDARSELGKTTGPHNFSTEHSLCNWALTGHFGPLNPHDLDCQDMRRLTAIRRRNSVLILKMQDYAGRKIKLRNEFPLTTCLSLEVSV